MKPQKLTQLGRWILAGLVALGTSGALASDEQRFDGTWLTTVSCAPVRDALGYSYRFVGEIRNGAFRGQYGDEGKPSSLTVDGQILPDGTGKLYAQGRTGSKEFVPGRDTPRGTAYGYHIEARFEGTAGAGRRVEGRSCSFEFEKRAQP